MRLIDADALLEKRNHAKVYSPDMYVIGQGYVMDAKTIEAVPVVHCKDCQYYQDNNGGYPHEECRWGHDETPDADDYCSYGAKMDADDVKEDA